MNSLGFPEDSIQEKAKPILGKTGILGEIFKLLAIDTKAIWLQMVMQFIPVQGIIAVRIGIIPVDFHGKYKIQQWIIHHTAILRYINKLHTKAKQSTIEV